MLRFTSLYILLLALVSLSCLVRAELSEEDKKDKEQGVQLFLDAVKTLVYGEDPANSYKDMFIDTSKDIFSQIDSGNEGVTVDDMLRIFVQSIMILVGSRRPDLIPRDFNDRNKVFGKVIDELQKIFEFLSDKGTNYVNLGAMKVLLTNLQKDEFWISLSHLKKEVDEAIELQALKALEDSKTTTTPSTPAKEEF